MSSIAVLKNLPEPAKTRKARVPAAPRESKYPFAILEVGDGFFAVSKGIGSAVAKAQKSLGHRYKTFKGEQDGKEGRFVKRIA